MTSRAHRAPETSAARDAAVVFKALADPVRIALIELIGREPSGEACFEALAERFDSPQSSLSHHLKVLVQCGVLDRERRGTYSWYSLNTAALDSAAQLLMPGGLAPRPPSAPDC